jgi:hypothetical protein
VMSTINHGAVDTTGGEGGVVGDAVPSSSKTNIQCSGSVTQDGGGDLGWLSVPVSCRYGIYIGVVIMPRMLKGSFGGCLTYC